MSTYTSDQVAAPHMTELKVVKHAQERRFWLFDAGLRSLNFWLFMLFLSSYATGYDGALFAGLTTLKVWFTDMGNPKGQILGLIGTSVTLGTIFSPFLASYINDKWGRRPSLIVASLVSVIFGVLTSIRIADPDSQRNLFIICRVFLSFGSGWALVTAPLLTTELAHPDHRAIATCIYFSGFYVGSLTSGWLTFGTNSWTSSWAWRFPALFQIVPFAFQFIIFFWMPESPRWLVANGKEDEARRLLTKYHANGQEGSTLVQAEMHEITTSISLESERASWLEMLKTPANRHRTWIAVSLGISGQWVGNGVVAYYLPSVLQSIGVTNTAQQAKFNGCLAIFNLVISIAAASQAERVGRRPMFFTGGFGMLGCFAIITALSATYAKEANPALGKGVIAFLFLFYGFYDIGITPLQIGYPVEVMPYRLRAKGLALTLSINIIALVFNIYVNPIALESIAWKYYFVFIAVLIFFIINAYFYYPEVKGRTLEQIDAIFEKSGKGQDAEAANLSGTVAQLSQSQHPSDNRSASPSSEKKEY